MNATCTDLINDFRCECPEGFTGKRCHEKIDLCGQNSCINGLCVDMLHTQRCICEPGWTGEVCDSKINQCASRPCLNGATCKEQVFKTFLKLNFNSLIIITIAILNFLQILDKIN